MNRNYFNIHDTTAAYSFNTFASERFFFEGKTNERFYLENTSNLTIEFQYAMLTRKFVKVVIKKLCVKFDVFSRRNSSFNFPSLVGA